MGPTSGEGVRGLRAPGDQFVCPKCGAEMFPRWMERVPMGRMGETSGLQGAVAYLAAEVSDYITGSDIPFPRCGKASTMGIMSHQSVRALTLDISAKFIRYAIDCVQREYPNVLGSDAQTGAPRDIHPVFFGCFDWHSSVHGHWAMAHVLRLYPSVECANEMRALFNDHFTADRIAAEATHLSAANKYFFECPYGWAWFLVLCRELSLLSNPEAKSWREALKPLEELIADRSIEYFDRLTYPIRHGVHQNSAFSLSLMIAYAEDAGNQALAGTLRNRAKTFFADDTRCPLAYEPSGQDFLSPCLAEANLMRRVLPADEFGGWLDQFLPESGMRELAMLLAPPAITDASDPLLGHLVGLAFHRAWALRELAAVLGHGDPRCSVFLETAQANIDSGLVWINGSDYVGTHWLATYAISALGAAWPQLL
ncbi:MAG: DUF2891 family protein [Spirochaetales bacterium]|jgi:hypothetical protein|nr:DUF2891 family protein [Spirochaetales bacterium]